MEVVQLDDSMDVLLVLGLVDIVLVSVIKEEGGFSLRSKTDHEERSHGMEVKKVYEWSKLKIICTLGEKNEYIGFKWSDDSYFAVKGTVHNEN